MVDGMDGPGHSGSTLGAARIFDRQSARRVDEAYLGGLQSAPTSRFLLLIDLKPVLTAELGAAAVELAWLSPAAVAELGIGGQASAFLGCDPAGRAHFSFALDGTALPAAVAAAGLPERASELRAIAVDGRLPPDELSIAGEARALAEWHDSHRYCSRCGAPTMIVDGGWRRHCGGCLKDHFPRTDPVVIMLVTHGDACLLARSPRFPGRLVSALAGFLEPGEDIEHAVAREVKEEVGLAVTAVRYLSASRGRFPIR